MDLQQILKHGQQPQLMLSQQQPAIQPFTLPHMPVTITSSRNHQLTFPNCTVEISEESIVLIVGEAKEADEGEEKVVNVMFANVSSVGVQGGNVMVFLEGGENQEEEDQEEEEVKGEHEAEKKEAEGSDPNGLKQGQKVQPIQHTLPSSPFPEILRLIRDHSSGTFNLNGNYTISLSFQELQPSLKTQTHQLLISYLNSNDDSNDDENQNNFMMDQMISADQINEDGTINKFYLKDGEGQEQQEESEDGDSGEEGEEMDAEKK